MGVCQSNELDILIRSIHNDYKYLPTKDYEIRSGNGQIIFKHKNYMLSIEKTQDSIIKLSANSITIDTVLKGNCNFYGSIKDWLIDEESVSFFEYKGCGYWSIPLQIKDCNGSFCRSAQCLLIEIKDGSVLTFFFGNLEIAQNDFFNLSSENDLLFLNVFNSFSNPIEFKKYRKKIQNGFFYYKIKPMFYNMNSQNWEYLKTKENSDIYFIIRLKKQYNTQHALLVDSRK